jgi:hypothetical protein
MTTARKVNTGQGYGFSTKQTAALEMLVAGQSQAEVARQIGTDPSVVCRWSKNPLFRSELQRRKSEVLDGIRSRLNETVTACLDSIIRGMADEECPASVKMQTASSFLARVLPGLLKLDVEPEPLHNVLKSEAEMRRDRLLSGALDGTDEILDEARSELERTA